MSRFFGFIVILVLLNGLVSGQSCEDRCGDNLDPNESCQCNEQCANFGDCCDDYEELCLGTCEGRCGDNLDPDLPCQCNDQCIDFGDCCNDFEDVCGGGSGSVSDEELRNFGETLWNSDVNRMPDSGYTIDENGPQFFSYVDESYLQSVDTFSLFLTLLDNYNPNVGQEEGSCSSCDDEESAFLDAVMQTSVMQQTWEFLSAKGFAADTLEGFRDELDQYWFGDYGRSSGGPIDSSGFEHVMVGELDGSSVSGFHNWVQFYVAERDGELQFDDLTGNCEPDYIKAAFNWLGNFKSGGSMFLATSPEMDMAMYTICFLARRNSNCVTSLNGQSVSIQTYDMSNADFLAVGTAYVNCN